MKTPLTQEMQNVLRLAGIAAGRAPDDVDERGAWYRIENDPFNAWQPWNPLLSPGEALSLAAQLEISIAFDEDSLEVRAETSKGYHWTELLCEHSNNRLAATCVVITRLAAVIGRDTPPLG